MSFVRFGSSYQLFGSTKPAVSTAKLIQNDLAFRLQFRLRTLLLFAIPIAVVALIASFFIKDRPIDWIEYSPEKLASAMASRQTVLVFYTADWDPTAKICENDSIDTFWVRRIIRNERILALRADCTEWQNFSHRDIPESIKFGATPIVATHNFRDSEQPAALMGNLITEDDVYNSIRNTCREENVE